MGTLGKTGSSSKSCVKLNLEFWKWNCSKRLSADERLDRRIQGKDLVKQEV